MVDYNEVINRVDGLNSLSTLKKWRLKAEELAGVSFCEAKTRCNSNIRLYLFSNEDIQKFQQVADTKAHLGLDTAI